MKKNLLLLWITFFLPLSAFAFIPPSLWIVGEMAKRCGFPHTMNVQGTYQVTRSGQTDQALVDIKASSNGMAITSSSSKNVGFPTSFLDKFMSCGEKSDKVSLLKDYLTLHGVNIDKVSFAFFKNQIAYILGDEGQSQIWVDKESLLPIQENMSGAQIIFENWTSVFDDKKMLPTQISVKSNGEEIRLDFSQKSITEVK